MESGNNLFEVSRAKASFNANAIFDPIAENGSGAWRPMLVADLGSAPAYDAIPASSFGFTSGIVAKASAGHLLTLQGYNNRGTAQFIHVYDASIFPPNGTIPSIVLTVAANSNFTQDFNFGARFLTGIVVANSASGAQRSGAAADCSFYVVRR